MIIVAIDKYGNRQEIDDLYWFEENWIHTFEDKGYVGYTFRFESEQIELPQSRLDILEYI